MSDVTGIPQDTGDATTRSAILNHVKLLAQLVSAMSRAYPATARGSLTLGAAVSTVVTDAAVTATARILLFPSNAAAATLVGSAKSPYVASQIAGTSFTVATANATASAGTETFNYVVLP